VFYPFDRFCNVIEALLHYLQCSDEVKGSPSGSPRFLVTDQSQLHKHHLNVGGITGDISQVMWNPHAFSSLDWYLIGTSHTCQFGRQTKPNIVYQIWKKYINDFYPSYFSFKSFVWHHEIWQHIYFLHVNEIPRRKLKKRKRKYCIKKGREQV